MEIIEDDYYINFRYSFSSVLGPMEESRYVREMSLFMELININGEIIEVIGEVDFLYVYLEIAINNNEPIYEILDAHSEYLSRHSFAVFDFKNLAFKEIIKEYYNHDIFGSNFCLIKEIKLLPHYRKMQLGIKALKDIIFHFSSGTALFLIQPFPLQFGNNQFDNNYHIDQLEKDEQKAFNILKEYYKTYGFEEIEGIDDFLFFNPVLKNEKLDRIDLEEDLIIKPML
ncbi:MAG: hypothetical protein ACNS60_15795 [Candidatus Cyclobacteriaceae bacterium M2_1C_046]